MNKHLRIFILSIILFSSLFSNVLAKNNPDSLINLVKNVPDTQKAVLYNKIAKSFYREKKLPLSFEYFKKTLQWAKKNNDSLLIAKSYNNIAVVYDITGNYQEAVAYYNIAMKIFYSLFNIKYLGIVYNNLGVIYEEMKEPGNALKIYYKALELKTKIRDTLHMAGTLNNIGIIFNNDYNNNDSALYYYKKAYHCYSVVNNQTGKNIIKSNTAVILFNQQQDEKALKDLFSSLHYFQKSGNVEEEASNLLLITNIYIINKDYQKAISYVKKALSITDTHNFIRLKSSALYAYFNVMEKTGNFKKALQYFKKYDSIKEVLFNNKKRKIINDNNFRINLSEKSHEIELLKKQDKINKLNFKRTNLILIITLLSLLSLILLLTFIVFRYKINKKTANEESIILKTRLLRSQMAPHFIFNTLMGIQSMLIKGENEKAMDYLVEFAKLMRSLLVNSNITFVTLESEISVLKHYIKLEKMRLAYPFDLNFKIEVDAPLSSIQMPPMLLQPFIENAIVHGLAPKMEKGTICILFKQKQEKLLVIIEDNGIGRNKSKELNKIKHYDSKAIELTKKRIKMLYHRYKKKINFTITDLYDDNNNPIGTRVDFVFDIFYNHNLNKSENQDD